MRGLNHLRERGVEYNVLTTLHAGNAQRGAEVYRFLRDECGARHIQFIPIIERVPDDLLEIQEPPAAAVRPDKVFQVPATHSSWRDRPLYKQQGHAVTDRSILPEQYGRFLVDVFEDWVRHDVGTVYVQLFDVALANWYGEHPGLCIHSETCGLALAMEHNGDLYSCDHFVEPAYRLGNILETPMADLVASEQQQAFGLAKRSTLPEYCRTCDVRFACHGGCPKDRFLHTPDGEAGLNYLCAGYKAFFHHIDRPMRFMTEMLRQNRAPAEIMAVYAQQERELTARFKSANRNDPCPCGSGRKFKQCHGRAASPVR
jgi:uncharacterized protein